MTHSSHPKKTHCVVCKKSFPRHELYPLELARDSLLDLIGSRHPETTPHDYICPTDYQTFRDQHLSNLLETKAQALEGLHHEVLDSIKHKEILSKNVNASYQETLSFGQRLADRVSAFGGSWGFVSSFLVLLCLWMILNSFLLVERAYDPYPYILLNLILSCVAALQAPIIMMSQNRREARDRLQAENDYKVNLKAELEIRQLNLKIDKFMTSQWNRLVDLQDQHHKILKALEGKQK